MVKSSNGVSAKLQQSPCKWEDEQRTTKTNVRNYENIMDGVRNGANFTISKRIAKHV
jgi:hypothetical protein